MSVHVATAPPGMTETADPIPAPVEAELAEIARRIRQWRADSGLTLHKLAQRSGVATSTIQKVETLQMVPSVAVLLKIARGLGRSAGDFVGGGAPATRVAHLPSSSRRAIESRRMVVERLSGDLSDVEIELWRVTLQPGASSGGEPYAYDGEELIAVETGTLFVQLGGDRFVLGPADTLHFKADQRHRWRNDGDEPARFVVVGTRPAPLRSTLGLGIKSSGRGKSR